MQNGRSEQTSVTSKVEHGLSESESEEDSPKKEGTEKKLERKAKIIVKTSSDDSEDSSSLKKRGRGAKHNNKNEPAAKKKKVEEPLAEPVQVDFSVCEKKTDSGESWNFKISSWNVAGIRAWCKVSVFI